MFGVGFGNFNWPRTRKSILDEARRVAPTTKSRNDFLTVLNQNSGRVPPFSRFSRRGLFPIANPLGSMRQVDESSSSELPNH
jgi:hypothetical protein